MADCIGITLVKKFTYRGAPEEFSNTYHLKGTPPTTPAAWDSLIGLLAAAEVNVYPSSVSMVRAYCYATDNEDDDSVYVGDFSLAPIPGTLNITGGVPAPGDSAVWARWKTSRVNSKGKAIYLRKYFHPAYMATGGGDAILPAQKTALNGLATTLKDGSSGLTGHAIRSMHHDETILSTGASAFVTTRTLKRRGKRPGS